MYNFLSEYYLILKAMHIISLICWMAALLYLPRLFVYHTEVAPDSDTAIRLTEAERRLGKIIMTPAMLATFIFGVTLMLVPGMLEAPVGWLHTKLVLVMLLAGFHGFLLGCHRKFAAGHYPYSNKTFRLLNEIPATIMIIIVFLVVLKPF